MALTNASGQALVINNGGKLAEIASPSNAKYNKVTVTFTLPGGTAAADGTYDITIDVLDDAQTPAHVTGYRLTDDSTKIYDGSEVIVEGQITVSNGAVVTTDDADKIVFYISVGADADVGEEASPETVDAYAGTLTVTAKEH